MRPPTIPPNLTPGPRPPAGRFSGDSLLYVIVCRHAGILAGLGRLHLYTPPPPPPPPSASGKPSLRRFESAIQYDQLTGRESGSSKLSWEVNNHTVFWPHYFVYTPTPIEPLERTHQRALYLS
ncbi:hypothetical protein BDN70DRAFT_936868 [Pholiota conissans]|uniref:Uncharacterized protein n=1 Tax=Pholiota conissans TaxID=109636 RepID=A0A9P6CVH0_9AGAR|nr:hypothetical protein BDN70DRAFT_936868 [Pholiota conissans]